MMNNEKEKDAIDTSKLDEILPKYDPLKLNSINLAQNYVSAFNTGMNIYQCVNQLQGYIEWVVKAVNDVVKSWNVQVGESIDQSKAIVRETTTEQFNTEWTNKQPELIEQVNTLTTNQFNEDWGVLENRINTTLETQNTNIQNIQNEQNELETNTNNNINAQNTKINSIQTQQTNLANEQNTKINSIQTQQTNLANEQNTKINSIQTQQTTLSNRMDTFTRLSEGSTTGDAELQDIRLGANGVTYNNAGDAVRGQYSQLKEDLGKLNNDEVFINAEFINGSRNSNGISGNIKYRIISKTNITIPYDAILKCPSNRVMVTFLYEKDGTFISKSGEQQTMYIPKNIPFSFMYMRNDGNVDTSLLPITEISNIKATKIDKYSNYGIDGKRILSGNWYWGNTNSNNAFEKDVIRRMTSLNIIKFNNDIVIPKLDGYIINARIFNGNTQVRSTSTDLDGDLIIYANEEFKLNIMRDDANADTSRLDANILMNVKYYPKNQYVTYSKKQYDKIGIINSNNNIIKLDKINSLGELIHSQSVSIDIKNKLIYVFGGETYGYRVYDINGKYIKTREKLSTGHDNDCVNIGDYIYFADGGTKSLVKWNMNTDTYETINVNGINDNGNPNTVRNICGVCIHNSNEQELIVATYDRNTTNDLLHSEGDKLAIYLLHLNSSNAELLCEFDWDCVYIQGCTMYNNMIYVTCNIQTTEEASNYKGVEIKCINLSNKNMVDVVKINGTFENEGLDYCVENGIVYLYTILSKYGNFVDLVKFKAPFIN